jgi:hypothetical protein
MEDDTGDMNVKAKTVINQQNSVIKSKWERGMYKVRLPTIFELFSNFGVWVVYSISLNEIRVFDLNDRIQNLIRR